MPNLVNNSGRAIDTKVKKWDDRASLEIKKVNTFTGYILQKFMKRMSNQKLNVVAFSISL